MRKYLKAFRTKDYLMLLIVIITGGIWLVIDQNFLDAVYQRFLALALIFIILFLIQLIIGKPDHPLQYSIALSIVCTLLNMFLSFVIHVLIQHNFSVLSVLIWLITAISPFLSLFIYKRIGFKVRT
jgi:hypothetical protein